MRIFLSYSRRDKEIAQQLVDALEPYHEIWCDWEDENIQAGEKWQSAIAHGIRRCGVFLFLASENSVASEYCKWEIHLAQRWRKPIIPVVISENISMSKELSQLQWVFLNKDFERAIRSLINAARPKPSPHWVYVALVEAVAIAVLVLGR